MSCARRPRIWSGTRWANGGVRQHATPDRAIGASATADADCPPALCRRHGRRARGLSRGRAVVGGRAPALRRRPASRKRLVLRPPRPDAAALRHWRDARPLGSRSSPISIRRSSWPLATASMTTTGLTAFRPSIAHRWLRSSPAATGSGSPAITIPHLPEGHRAAARLDSLVRRPAHLPPRASGRPGRRRDRRPSSSRRPRHRPRPVGPPPLLRRRWPPPDPARLRRLCRRPRCARSAPLRASSGKEASAPSFSATTASIPSARGR